MKYRSSIFIPNPIEEVFDFAVDQVGASRWQYQVGVKHLSGEENALGSTYERTSSVRGRRVPTPTNSTWLRRLTGSTPAR